MHGFYCSYLTLIFVLLEQQIQKNKQPEDLKNLNYHKCKYALEFLERQGLDNRPVGVYMKGKIELFKKSGNALYTYLYWPDTSTDFPPTIQEIINSWEELKVTWDAEAESDVTAMLCEEFQNKGNVSKVDWDKSPSDIAKAIEEITQYIRNVRLNPGQRHSGIWDKIILLVNALPSELSNDYAS